jgi:hypothetical protein
MSLESAGTDALVSYKMEERRAERKRPAAEAWLIEE